MTTKDTSTMSINIIAIRDVIRRDLGLPFTPYLMNREQLGVPLRNAIASRFNAPSFNTFVVDFTGIAEMSVSVADEIGPKLLEDFLLARENRPDIYLAYSGLSREIVREFETLNWQSDREPDRSLSIVAFRGHGQEGFHDHIFVGKEIPSSLTQVLDLVYQLGEANSQVLETHGVKAASRKLNELVRQYPWLFRKDQKSLDSGPKAWAYFYTTVVPVVICEKG